METLAEMVSQEGDAVSKELKTGQITTEDSQRKASNHSKDVDSILEDIDNIVNGATVEKSTFLVDDNGHDTANKCANNLPKQTTSSAVVTEHTENNFTTASSVTVTPPLQNGSVHVDKSLNDEVHSETKTASGTLGIAPSSSEKLGPSDGDLSSLKKEHLSGESNGMPQSSHSEEDSETLVSSARSDISLSALANKQNEDSWPDSVKVPNVGKQTRDSLSEDSSAPDPCKPMEISSQVTESSSELSSEEPDSIFMKTVIENSRDSVGDTDSSPSPNCKESLACSGAGKIHSSKLCDADELICPATDDQQTKTMREDSEHQGHVGIGSATVEQMSSGKAVGAANEAKQDEKETLNVGCINGVVSTAHFSSDSKDSPVLDKLAVGNLNTENKLNCCHSESPSDPGDSTMCSIQILESTSIDNADVFLEDRSNNQEGRVESPAKNVNEDVTSSSDEISMDVNISSSGSSKARTDIGIDKKSVSVANSSDSTQNQESIAAQENVLTLNSDEQGGDSYTSAPPASQSNDGSCKEEKEQDVFNHNDTFSSIEAESNDVSECEVRNKSLEDEKGVRVTGEADPSDVNHVNRPKENETHVVDEPNLKKDELLTKGEKAVTISTDKHSLENGRKRSLVPEDQIVLEPKRAKVSAKNEPNSAENQRDDVMEVIDCDDDIILEEDIDVKDSKGELVEDVKPKETKCNESKEIKAIGLKVESKQTANAEMPQKVINISSQVLQAFVTARVKAFIKKQKLQQIEKLNKRITGMQSSTNLWRETTKQLERSVKDAAAANQSLEKRRKLLSRSVGVQVNDDKVRSATMTVQQMKSAADNRLHGPDMLKGTPGFQNPPGVHRPLQPRSWTHQQVNHSPNRPQPPPSTSSWPNRPAAQAPPRPPPPAADVVNLIDLTDDDEVSKKPSGTTSSHLQPYSSIAISRTNVMPAAKNVPPPVNKFMPADANRPPAAPASNSSGKLAAQHRSAMARAHPKPSQMGGQSAAMVDSTVGSNGMLQGSAKQVKEPSGSKSITMHTLPPSLFMQQRHPAPLPPVTESNPPNVRLLKLPPKPTLKISRVSQGIVLSWNMPSLLGIEVIVSYQLFAYQETEAPPRTNLWKKVGDVRALPLPMACTLTQFQEGNKYHFAVRAVDQYNRTGAFSDPSSIFLGSSNS